MGERTRTLTNARSGDSGGHLAGAYHRHINQSQVQEVAALVRKSFKEVTFVVGLAG